jgi:uncharacterized protein YbdZ (MbtH family)
MDMSRDRDAFAHWLDEARIPQAKRTLHQLAVLKASFAFLEQAGRDYASRRLVAHFLLNCQLDLKLAQVARLIGITRPTASRQNKLSCREVVREIQHQFTGRPYGKLLPRYAGPVAHFLVTHADASRDDVLDFIERTWNIRVSRQALHNFLKKYGLDRNSLDEATPREPHDPATDERALVEVLQEPPTSGLPVPQVSEDFFLATRITPVPSCCSHKFSAGGTSPGNASPMSTAHCNVGF